LLSTSASPPLQQLGTLALKDDEKEEGEIEEEEEAEEAEEARMKLTNMHSKEL
jgi:hypothetical protein